MVPTSLTGHWCLYVWDLEEKRIHILDPVLGCQGRSDQAASHSDIIACLHGKMVELTEELLAGWMEDHMKYKSVYYNFTHGPAKK